MTTSTTNIGSKPKTPTSPPPILPDQKKKEDDDNTYQSNEKNEIKENPIISYFSSAKDLKPGDHIYIWKCAYLYQRHAMVLSVEKENNNGIITIVEFYNDKSNIHITSLENFASKTTKIKKVQYAASWFNRCVSRSGTVTSQDCDEQSLILARLQYIVDNPHVLPTYNTLSSNDECICVWILTGIYCTLQVCSQLYVFSASQIKSAVVTSGVVSHMTVSVPVTGMWGYLGYTTTVPLTTAQPIIIPLLVGYGLISILPLEMLRRYKKKWRAIEEDLDREFWMVVGEDVLERYWLKKHWYLVEQFFDGDVDDIGHKEVNI